MSKPILQPQPNTDSDSDKPTLSAAIYLRAMRKVPEVMVYFWIIKLLTTAMGEVTSDYLAHQLTPIIAVALGGIGLAVALVLQFSCVDMWHGSTG